MTDKINYKQFNGDARIQIPTLLKAGYRLATMSDVAKLRIQGDLRNIYIDTSTAVLYDTKGNVKIDPESSLIHGLNKCSDLVKGALRLNDGIYNSVDAQEFTKKDISKYTNSYLTREQAKKNPFWTAMINDKLLREEYVDLIFDNIQGKNMDISLDFADNHDKLRAVYSYGLGSRSLAFARGNLGDINDQFVGISVGDASQKSLENMLDDNVLSAIKSGSAFKFNGILYVPTNANNLNIKG